MPDFNSAEEEASRYILGELREAETREFQARMAESSELRALVRNLQEGAVGLALTAPQKSPPAKAWENIESSLILKPRFRHLIAPLKSGWAAAAVITLGWIIYGFWNQPQTAHAMATTNNPGGSIGKLQEYHAKSIQTELDSNSYSITDELLKARAQEVGNLRLEVAALQKRLQSLSEDLNHHQATLNEPTRLKFYHMAPLFDSETTVAPPDVNPILKQAMLLAVARELGWLGNTNLINYPENEERTRIDFVDLRPGFQSTNQSSIELKSQSQPVLEQSSETESLGATLPAFVSGEKLLVALDNRTAPPGSEVTFTVHSGNQVPLTLGTTGMGANPIVVTLPFSPNSANSWTLRIGAASPGGAQTFQQFTAESSP